MFAAYLFDPDKGWVTLSHNLVYFIWLKTKQKVCFVTTRVLIRTGHPKDIQ